MLHGFFFSFFSVQVGSKTVETCYLLMMAVPSPTVVGEGGSRKLPDFVVLVCLCFISTVEPPGDGG